MIRQTVTLTNTGTSDPIRTDPTQSEISILALLGISNTATATVEFTPDKPDATLGSDNWTNSTWYSVADLTDKTATAWAKIDTPVEGIRANCTAYTSGNVTLQAVQGDAK